MNWSHLYYNKNVIDILREAPDKINGCILSENASIFTIDTN